MTESVTIKPNSGHTLDTLELTQRGARAYGPPGRTSMRTSP